jgi:hypothetical protein
MVKRGTMRVSNLSKATKLEFHTGNIMYEHEFHVFQCNEEGGIPEVCHVNCMIVTRVADSDSNLSTSSQSFSKQTSRFTCKLLGNKSTCIQTNILANPI